MAISSMILKQALVYITMNSDAEQDVQSRHHYTQDELQVLRRSFAGNPKPSRAVKEQLAEELDLSIDKINIWFQNRRSEEKRKQKEQDN